MNAKEVGTKIAFLRKEQNMTQIELAEKLSLTNKAISKWETGDGYPDITIFTSFNKNIKHKY
jgi:transcriptional regulator with XRE-family HTH domain